MTDKATDVPVTMKPCPFCGSGNIDPTGWQSIDAKGPACDDCGASAGQISLSHDDNIAAWNHRTASEQPASGEVALPRLDSGLIEAAMRAHYGENASGIDGVDLTANDRNWSFREGFTRMWGGVRAELKHRALSTTSEAPAHSGEGRSNGAGEAVQAVRDDQCNVEFGTVPDCDCPHEHWHIGGVCLDVHIEEDGSGHSILGNDDWQLGVKGVESIDEMRAIAFAWASQKYGLAALSAPQGEVERPDAEEDDRSWLGTSIDRIDAMEDAAQLREIVAGFVRLKNPS